MILVIGGAYQGKLEYAKENLHINDNDICDCRTQVFNSNSKCLYHYETYVFECIKKGTEPELPVNPGTVVIADDVFCGIVPMDKDVRAWREKTGRLLTRIASSSSRVIRVFCGLGMDVK